MIQMKWAASCIAAAGRGPGRQQEARCRKGNESERCGATRAPPSPWTTCGACSAATARWRASSSSPATAPPSPTATSAASPSWSRARSWSWCAGSSACSCPATRSGRWRGRSGRSSTTTTFRPRPLLPALAPAQPALRRRHPGRGEALARAPLQPQRAPTPCRRHGHGQGGRRRDLRGRSAGRGLGLRQDDTRLLVPARPKSYGGGRRRKGSRAGEEWQQVNICGWCGICIAGTFQTQNNL